MGTLAVLPHWVSHPVNKGLPSEHPFEVAGIAMSRPHLPTQITPTERLLTAALTVSPTARLG